MWSVYGTTIPGERVMNDNIYAILFWKLAGSAVVFPLILPRCLSPPPCEQSSNTT